MNRKNRNRRFIVYAAALAVFCLAAWSGCHKTPSGLRLDDLSGWVYVAPNSVGVGEECTRYSFIFNNHQTDTAYVDSCTIDTLHFNMDFIVAPLDTFPAVEESNRTYAAAGTYIHTLTYYTTIGTPRLPALHRQGGIARGISGSRQTNQGGSMHRFMILLASVTAVCSAQWLDTTITVAAGPFALCYNSQNDRVYCACFDSDTVVVIDGATNAILAAIPVGDQPGTSATAQSATRSTAQTTVARA